ncbi:hypothetical protein PSHT_08099 [Puccinia striiformis]|uniref:Uncharacterized protein n=1 Tax=Puccinia striiformis TaxID=27350 RepID=A0A2S4VS56_9BASI|nr:hypothetical protein PSHT_08099 [Puccinia striiformis]
MSDLGSELSDNPHLTDTSETQQLRQQADERAYTSRILIIRIEELTPYFQSYMALVILYIVPSYRDIYFRDWFVSWNTSFSVASYNAIQSVHVFEQDEP